MITKSFLESGDLEADYSFDVAKIGWDVGQPALRDQRPADGLFYQGFDSVACNWFRGSTGTGSLVGAATISGGKINLPTTNDSYWRLPSTGNMPSGGKGCVRFTFTPAYSTTTGGVNRYLFSASAAENSPNNLLSIMHINNVLKLEIFDSSGVSIHTSQTGNGFAPTAGTPYEFELNWDTVTGQHRLFINGVLLNGVKTGTGTTGARGLIRVGKDYTSSVNVGAYGTIDNLIVFNEVQHTANYTPGAAIQQTRYPIDNPSISNAAEYGTEVSAIVSDVTAAGSDSVRVAVEVDGVLKYHNGVAWVNSSGYSESNAINTYTAEQLAALVVVEYWRVAHFLHSADGSTTPTLNGYDVTWIYEPSPVVIDTTTVYGYFKDHDGNPVTEGTVSAVLVSASFVDGANTFIPRQVLTVDVQDARGYYIFSGLIPSSLLGGTKYEFRFKAQPGDILLNRYVRTVPVSGDPVEFESLTP